MLLASAPLAAANDRTPSVDPSFRGVTIVASRQKKGAPLRVDGVFRVSQAEANLIGRPLHRSLVCIVWNYGESVTPFREVVLFPDDEVQKGEAVSGAFSFQLPVPQPGMYLHVALGEHLSASVRSPD
jgi:hypothetical protein